MVEAIRTLIGVVLLANSLWFGQRAITAGRLYRSVSTSEDGSPSTLVDGEKVAIEGTVNVKDPAPRSDSLSTDEGESVGAYVWRLKESESSNYNLDAEEPGADMNMITYASGIESGTFTVDDGQREVRIDTDWLTEAHDSADITTVSTDWTVSTRQSRRSWSSPYIQLEEHWTVNPDPIVEYVFDADAAEEIPDDEYFEARAVLDGEILAVRGEVSVERGTPVLQGSDEEPLVLSDRGFDEFRRSLRYRILKCGLVASGFGFVASLALANGLGVV